MGIGKRLFGDTNIEMKKIIVILFTCILAPIAASAQLYWNHANLRRVKSQLDVQPYNSAYLALIKKADVYLTEPHLSVVDDKEHIPASGDIHDYMSIARYAWPDTTKTDGLPYIERDGYTNPEYYTYDREVLLKMVDRVKTLTLAWYFSNNRMYASAAVEQIRVWFLSKNTYMNPNMYYGQVVKGYSSLNATGVLDGAGFVDLIDALYLLDNYRSWGWHRDLRRVQKWFTAFLNWIETSDQGIRESKARDNTGTAYDLQRLAYNIYCRRDDKAQQIFNGFVENRINKQINAQGVQVEEVKRTSSFGYSVSNITVMMNFITIAHNQGLELNPVAQTLFYKAIDYLIPYLDESKKWPYQEIANMKYYRNRLCFELFRISTCLDKSKLEYLKKYELYGKMSENDINNLLYY